MRAALIAVTALAGVLAVMLAGCVGGAPAAKEPEMTTSAIPAPAPEGVTLRLTAQDKGGRFSLHKGQKLSVALVGVPTAGYVWAAPKPPAMLKKAGEASGPTSQAQKQPGFTGGNHWEVLVFEAVAPGVGELRLEQARPWETNEAPADVWTATISVD